jgi:sortase B
MNSENTNIANETENKTEEAEVKEIQENTVDKKTEPDAEPEKTAEAEPAPSADNEAKPAEDEAATKIFRPVSDNNMSEQDTDEDFEETTEEVEERPVKKASKTSPIRIAILVICIAVFAFSGYKIVMEIIDGVNTDKMSEDIRDSVRIDDGETEEGHDDINVPPAPIDPNVSGSGTGKTPAQNSSGNAESTQGIEEAQNNENTDKSENTDNTGSSEQTQTETTTPADNTQESSETVENQQYDDRTYEEELQEQEEAPEDTQYYISRPSKDKDVKDVGVVIRPEEIKMTSVPYLRVSNLKSLLRVNEDTVGWIYMPGSKEEAKGTPIDTAIVQTTDNEYYLDHTFDKKENANGWVYADYRCNLDSITSNYNTVIYGHARSYTMFGGLKNLNEAVEWYSDGYNHFIKINTFKDETVWQIFSWYETDIYYDYIKTDFADSNDFIRFAYDVQRKNQMTGVFETFEFSENDRILTLSTCKGFDRAVRVAVHAKLVKRNDLTAQ